MQLLSTPLRLCIAVIALTAIGRGAFGQNTIPDSTILAIDTVAVAPSIAKELSVTELIVEIEEANRQLHQIDNELILSRNALDNITEMKTLEKSIRLLDQSIDRENLEQLNLNVLNSARNEFRRYHDKLQFRQNQILNRSENLSQHKREILDIENTFLNKSELLRDTTLTPLFEKRLGQVLEQAATLKDRLNADLQRIISIQNDIVDLEIIISNTLDDIEFYGLNYKFDLLNRNALLWQRTPTTTDDSLSVTKTIFSELREDLANTGRYLKDYHTGIYWQLMVLGLMVLLLYRLRAKAADLVKSQQAPPLTNISYVLRYPWASALLVALVLSPLFYLHPPVFLMQFFTTLMIVPLGIIIYARSSWWELLSYLLLSVAYFFAELETSVSIESLGQRFFLLITSGLALGSILTLLSQTYASTRPYPSFFKGALWFFGMVFLVAIGANVLGYVSLASMLTRATTQSLLFGILIFLSYRVLEVIIILLIYSKRFQRSAVIRKNQKIISENLFQIVSVALALYWIGIVLTGFGIYDTIYRIVSDFLLADRVIGSYEFSLWSILTFVLVIWASITLSRLIKYMLEQRYLTSASLGQSKKGAYILLLRYFILLSGLLLAIIAAGIPLDKVTIILGALSVGIGFGLQNIVNNLVSGVILALERPIQTGDIIEVSSYIGVVKDIGIRSSTVNTFDGAEVIIPNANFIAGEVTNWTLSNKHRRVEVMVGVAYGSNSQQVSKVLLQALDNNPDIMPTPPPMCLFHSFGDSSINFRVLFWARTMENWLTLRSEVMEQIYQRLADANIEIPFPQRDLHIKSDLTHSNGHREATPLTRKTKKNPTQKT